jgi:hypothetical protein
MVAEYRAGRVLLAGLRGRSAFRFLEQAAQDAARRTFGDLRIDAYQPVGSDLTGPGRWRVLLTDPADPAGQIRVELAETKTEPLFSNCAATVPLAVPTFAVESIDRLS